MLRAFAGPGPGFRRLALLGGIAAVVAACSDPSDSIRPVLAKGGNDGTVSVASVTPDSVPRDTTVTLAVNGAGFDAGSTVALEQNGQVVPGATVNSVKVISAHRLLANVTLSAAVQPGDYDVAVTTAGGRKGIGIELLVIEERLAAEPLLWPMTVIEPLPGDVESEALGISFHNDVVGVSMSESGARRGFLRIYTGFRTPSSPIDLTTPGRTGTAYNVGFLYGLSAVEAVVVGEETIGGVTLPVRWRVSFGLDAQGIKALAAPPELEILSGGAGAAYDVSEPFAIIGVQNVITVGVAGGLPAIWAEDGTLTLVQPPAGSGFTAGEARSIGGGESIALNFWGGAPARGYVRTRSGVLIELPPAPGDLTSEVVDAGSSGGYFAGTSRSATGVPRAVLWRIENDALVELRTWPEQTEGTSGSPWGGMFLSSALGSKLGEAFFYDAGNLYQIPVPPGGVDPIVRNAYRYPAGGGVLPVGSALFNGHYRKAIGWFE